MIDYNLIPNPVFNAMRRYVNEGILPGHFLRAVICNDLTDAVGRGDNESLAALHSIVNWFFNHTPKTCWGSFQNMKMWEAMDEKNRKRILQGV